MNGLRLSPKKYQLFKTQLTYVGNEFSINKRTMTITPLRSRTEAVNKIPTPKTLKQCKSFCGMVNYLSLFCPDLQTLLKPIVELTRKGRPFIWGDAQEKASREVKPRLTNPPVLHLPKAEGRFILYSDTSIEGTGSSLWQIQEGKPRLIEYASKTLLDPSELIPISFCYLKVYRGFIDDKMGEDIFCIKTRSSAKASGDEVGEVHGVNKPLDPNYKPEHQSKSKLPSVTGKLSPREPILKTPARPTPKVLATLKSVRIQSETANDMPTPLSNPTPMGTPVLVHGGAQPKTHSVDGRPLLPTTLPSSSPPCPQLLVPRRILSSTPLGENGENMDRRDVLIRNIEEKRKILEEQNKNISIHPL